MILRKVALIAPYPRITRFKSNLNADSKTCKSIEYWTFVSQEGYADLKDRKDTLEFFMNTKVCDHCSKDFDASKYCIDETSR